MDSQVRRKKINFYTTSYDCLTWSSGWVSFYEYFKTIGIVEHNLFNKYVDYMNSGVFMSIFLDGLAVVCRCPSFVMRDDRYRLHCTTDAAIAWTSGYKQHYVHGVFFDEDLFRTIFIDKKYSSKDILSIKNHEQKAAVIQVFGFEEIIDEIKDKKILDEVFETSKQDGKPVHYQVLEFDLDGIKRRVVKVECHTEHKTTVIGVPIEKQTETCKGAIAWTFGLNPDEEYNPNIES